MAVYCGSCGGEHPTATRECRDTEEQLTELRERVRALAEMAEATQQLANGLLIDLDDYLRRRTGLRVPASLIQ